MNASTRRILYWAPRILGILYALFLSLFALDVFGVGISFWRSILAFLIHLVPVYLVVIVLVLAWRWEWVGAVAFAALGLLYLVLARGEHWTAYAAISGPLLLLGILFLLNWIYRTKLRAP